MNRQSEGAALNCFRCKHHYVTWDPAFPRGCKAYGFKTAEFPSQFILRTSGKPCMEFTDKSQKNGK